jgi:ABC-type phosphate transport system substrate-binding protein
MMNYRNCTKILAMAVALAGVPWAHAAELVVIGHPNAAALTKEQLADIYIGRNQATSPLDQPESSAIRAEFYKKATGKDLAQIKAVWSRLIFTGKGLPPKELPDSAAVKKAVAADPKAIGYVEKSAVDASVKVLVSVD